MSRYDQLFKDSSEGRLYTGAPREDKPYAVLFSYDTFLDNKKEIEAAAKRFGYSPDKDQPNRFTK